MRVESVARKAFTAGDQIQHTIGRGHLNGLIIVCSSYFSYSYGTLTVKRRSSSGPTNILTSGMTLADLSRINDHDGGFGYRGGQALQVIMERIGNTSWAAGDTATNIAGFESSFGELGVYAAYIDLGSIWLGNDSELDITLNIAAAATSGGTIALYRVSRERTPDRMVQYDLSYDFEATHRKVDKIFYVGATGSDGGLLVVDDATRLITTEEPAQFQLQDEYDSYLTDWLGCWAQTMLFGRFELAPQQGMVLIYQRPDAVPADVYCKVTGVSASASKYLIVRKVLYDERATSQNTIREAEKLVTKIAKLEAEEPQTAKAMRHAGVIPKADDLAAATAEVAQGSK